MPPQMNTRKNKSGRTHPWLKPCTPIMVGFFMSFMTSCGSEQPPAPLPPEAPVPTVTDRSSFEPEILSAFDQAIQKVRRSPRPENWSELGRIYHAHEQLQLGIESYQTAIDAGDAANQTAHLMALAHDEMGNREAAIISMRRATDLLPANPTSGWRLGQWLAEEGDVDGANNALLRALSLAPEDFGCLLAYGKFQLDMGRPQASLEPLAKAVKLQPKLPYPRFLIGQAMQQVGMEDEAARQLQLGRGSTPSWPDLHLQELNKLVRGPQADLLRLARMSNSGNAEQALPGMLLLAERLKDDSNYHLQITKAYRQLGRLTDAESSIARAMEIKADNPEALYQHAGLKRQRWLATPDRNAGNPFLSEALEFIDQAIRIRPNDADSHALRAQILASLGRLDESSAEWLNADRLDRGRNGFDFRATKVYIDAGEWEKAAEGLKVLVNRYPNDLPLRRIFGLTLYRAGDHDLARGILQTVNQKMPNDPEVLAALEELQ